MSKNNVNKVPGKHTNNPKVLTPEEWREKYDHRYPSASSSSSSSESSTWLWITYLFIMKTIIRTWICILRITQKMEQLAARHRGVLLVTYCVMGLTGSYFIFQRFNRLYLPQSLAAPWNDPTPMSKFSGEWPIGDCRHFPYYFQCDANTTSDMCEFKWCNNEMGLRMLTMRQFSANHTIYERWWRGFRNASTVVLDVDECRRTCQFEGGALITLPLELLLGFFGFLVSIGAAMSSFIHSIMHLNKWIILSAREHLAKRGIKWRVKNSTWTNEAKVTFSRAPDNAPNSKAALKRNKRVASESNKEGEFSFDRPIQGAPMDSYFTTVLAWLANEPLSEENEKSRRYTS